MSWKDKIKNQIIWYVGAIVVILMLTGVIGWIALPQSQSGFDDLLEKYSGYKIEIIVASVLALGILIYIGNSLAKKEKYSFIELFLGSLFLLVIAVAYVAKQNIVPVNKLNDMLIIGFLALLLGWIMGKMPEKR